MKIENKLLVGYLLLGGLWILFSDHLLFLLFDDLGVLTMMQTYKGWFYVILSSFIFYFIIRKHLIRLRNAEQKAKESDQMKSRFIQNISHEVRTPMNGIVGFSDLMVSDYQLESENYRYYAENIIKNSNQLLSVINNVLDISILESGEVFINREKFSLASFMTELEKSCQSLLKEGISLQVMNPEPAKKIIVESDKSRLIQIFNNLMGNAVKFTKQGEISIGYVLRKNEVCFYVKDEGIGVLPEEQTVIFERFVQTSNTRGKYGGTGLGLAISKELCTLLNGRIWVESEPERGATFYFTIPL